MYEKFKRWLASIFGYTTVSEQQIVEEMYKDLSKKIFFAKTLMELINAQQELKAFINYVERLGNPPWARGKVQAVTRYWNKRYRLWKLRG